MAAEHEGRFTCACGFRGDHLGYEGHLKQARIEAQGSRLCLQPDELNALLDRHVVAIVCTCTATFTSPFRYYLHETGRLEAFDAASRSEW